MFFLLDCCSICYVHPILENRRDMLNIKESSEKS
jgi:hypothetical protein